MKIAEVTVKKATGKPGDTIGHLMILKSIIPTFCG